MLEQIISLIAPHQCVSCATEGALLCSACQYLLPRLNSKCARCGVDTDSELNVWCGSCLSESPLDGLMAVSSYKDGAKELVSLLKFERARSAVKPMADVMAPLLRNLPLAADIWVVPLPTATIRARARGYDQAALIARRLTRVTGTVYAPLLRRTGKQRQVGASKELRGQQLQGVFWSTRQSLPSKPIYILVDDVITTGSSMQAAAEVLRACGANTIIGISFASA